MQAAQPSSCMPVLVHARGRRSWPASSTPGTHSSTTGPMQAACTIQLNLHVPLDEARHLVQLNLRCVRLQSARFHCAQAQRPVPHLRSVAWQDGSSGDHCAAGGSLCPPPPPSARSKQPNISSVNNSMACKHRWLSIPARTLRGLQWVIAMQPQCAAVRLQYGKCPGVIAAGAPLRHVAVVPAQRLRLYQHRCTAQMVQSAGSHRGGPHPA